MNILILGSGGREHAMAWKIAQSEKAGKIFIAPGNAGTIEVGTNVNIKENDFDAIKKLVLEKDIKLIIVGPEAPLVEGIKDILSADKDLKDVKIFAPSKHGAQLEGSKDFAKEFMQKHNIPTAPYQSFTKETLQQGLEYLENTKGPYVLKADGLAAGKGVLIINDLQEAKDSLSTMLNGQFGAASQKVVIEGFLDGIELSVFVVTDGKDYKILPEAKDYKRIGEGDTGLNTGGMGAVSPVPFADKAFMQKIDDTIIKPTIQGLQDDNIDYTGFIFFGLIKCDGEPFVIEYNARMGDPESEVVLPRLKSDLLELILASFDGTLADKEVEFVEDASTTVFLVSGGYPGDYEKGKEISCLKDVKDSIIFHAGTIIEDKKVVTNGGRVLAITSFGKDKDAALAKSFENAKVINFEGKNFRTDIGFDL